jgi:UDP-GlcNAc:undecaprenyl-phosphate/decaprenyl-phosphate GlcNAc-1-phosphate transferase
MSSLYLPTNFYFAFAAALLISVILTWLMIRVAFLTGITDRPGVERKIHAREMPLLGGMAVFLTFFAVIFYYRDIILSGDLVIGHWLGFLAGGVFLMIGGVLDDKYDLSPKWQFIWPILACASVVAGGVEIARITNPFGGIFDLQALAIGGVSLVSGLFIFIWLLGMMYTTKLLDGIDGLVGGVTAIGAFIIFLFTMTERYNQPDIGFASLILFGACLGFLAWNWHPARIFLGEGGSLFLGYALGVLAIISGGKIAIALLVMGLPIMDVAWTIIRRLKAGKNPFRFADRKHLHFRILDLGIGQRKTVLVYYAFALVFGLGALFLQSLGKLLALTALLAIMLGVVIVFNQLDKRSLKKDNG